MEKQQMLCQLREEAYRNRYPGTADLDLRICRLSGRGKTAAQIAMDIPCSESTVSRALHRVREFLSAQNYDRFLQTLRKAIDRDPPNFGDCDGRSVLEMLYTAYAENNEHETTEANASFLALDAILSDLPLPVSDSIFDKVCVLCSSYERSGFTEGFKLGVHMAGELSA